ncbi:beta-ketoacyl-ACP reductase [Mycolicibacterium chitae]|uniref:3-oxoacyl-[acyl-carrier-protein] reductase MabA n=1 Tax=Mycolicibacterium chitae TaxID=1792 RepID=A0A3S5EIM4_MYCCI|nr:SDR family oxidoreductase [Mycolicibacterium chitae]MCV7108555.1 SDR family oxidoreductase [Mycolicibacterium chitae]BBZ00788.1 beta-ketoacyl-ACP reductase [Mycolicibacterium chitae]VEG49636.1 short-chain dehydrogenase/reductase SDR [Mycolicibacterium chitae]
MSGLQGRVAIVTGSSRGVGRAIALRLAADGAAVAINYRREAAAADEVVAEIVAAGGKAKAYGAAINDEAAVDAMVEAVRTDLGPVDIVVSNAGTASKGQSVGDTPAADFLSLLQVHTLGPIHLLQKVLPDMRAAGRGDVVMVSSSTVADAPALSAPYTMAKAAMEMCVRTIAQEERANGIRANIVAPGLVETEMGRRLVKAATGGGTMDDIAASYPFGRVCTPEDVAGTVAYLVSADASYVTAQRITVDGGGRSVQVV